MSTTNLETRRIEYAFEVVEAWPAGVKDQAVQQVKGLPVQLRSQGLVVTVATLMNGKHAHLADMLARWLLDKAPHKPLANWTDERGGIARRLLRACTRAERSAFLAAQAEAIALTEHVKRFAIALEKAPS